MTDQSKSFLERLKLRDESTNPVLDPQWDQWSLDEEDVEEYRLKRLSTEYSNIGGVRDV